MDTKTILIVEDDSDIQELLRFTFAKEGFQVLQVKNGNNVMPTLEKHPVDAIILDLMLPGKDGMSLCRLIKANSQFASIPVVMVTAKSEETDVVAGLEVGADDYVSKPFSPKIVLARVRSLLRRAEEMSTATVTGDMIKIDNLVIDRNKHQVRIDNQPIELTLTEFEILSLLASKPGWVFSRSQIVDNVHGSNYAVSDRAIDVQIVGLRKKMGDLGNLISTVRGIGYKLSIED